jgi:mono/diheme cytochrome c family protein
MGGTSRSILRDVRSAARLLPALLAGLLLFAWAGLAAGVHLSPEGEKGEALFQEKCAACHTVGEGRSVGPDLADVTTKRDREWVVTKIADPRKLIDENDPVTQDLIREHRVRMPDLGISRQEADLLIAFLSEAGGAPPDAAPPPVEKAAPVQGDPDVGEKLFSGALRFENGAISCAACHGMAGVPGGGGTLGIDLTRMYEDYGEEGIMSVFADFPFPTMAPIYADRPLTPGEQAHLLAFLRVAAGREPPRATLPFVFIALGGAVLLGAVTSLLWGKRLHAVRRPLVDRMTLWRKPPK